MLYMYATFGFWRFLVSFLAATSHSLADTSSLGVTTQNLTQQMYTLLYFIIPLFLLLKDTSVP